MEFDLTIAAVILAWFAGLVAIAKRKNLIEVVGYVLVFVFLVFGVIGGLGPFIVTSIALLGDAVGALITAF